MTDRPWIKKFPELGEYGGDEIMMTFRTLEHCTNGMWTPSTPAEIEAGIEAETRNEFNKLKAAQER